MELSELLARLSGSRARSRASRCASCERPAKGSPRPPAACAASAVRPGFCCAASDALEERVEVLARALKTHAGAVPREPLPAARRARAALRAARAGLTTAGPVRILDRVSRGLARCDLHRDEQQTRTRCAPGRQGRRLPPPKQNARIQDREIQTETGATQGGSRSNRREHGRASGAFR